MIRRNTPFQELPELLTIEQFSAYLGISRSTAYDLVRNRNVVYRRFGHQIFIPKGVLNVSSGREERLSKF